MGTGLANFRWKIKTWSHKVNSLLYEDKRRDMVMALFQHSILYLQWIIVSFILGIKTNLNPSWWMNCIQFGISDCLCSVFFSNYTCICLSGIINWRWNNRFSHTLFILGHLISPRWYPIYYIGLNAIKHPGQFRWLDSSSTVRINTKHCKGW